MARHFGVERVLIVCPTSLKHQWQREIERFTGRTAEVIGGLRPHASRGFAEPGAVLQDHQLRHRPRRPRPDRRLGARPGRSSTRPSGSRTGTRAPPAASRRSQSPYAIVLTGTPLENRLEELISIVQFVDRYRLGPTFRFLARPPGARRGRQGGRLPRTSTRSARRWRRSCSAGRRTRCSTSCPSGIDKNVFVPMTRAAAAVHHDENREIVARIVAEVAALQLPLRGRPAPADDRPAEHAHVLRQHATCSTRRRDHGVKADEAGDAAGRAARTARHEGGHLQPVAADARAAGRSAPKQNGLGPRALPRRRAGRQAQGPGRPLPRRRRTAGCSSRPMPAASA